MTCMEAVPDQDEAVRRVRAALAYADMDAATAMRRLSISRSTLSRMTGRAGGERRRVDWADLWAVADACGLPREWFSVDLALLAYCVPEGAPVFVRSRAGVLVEAPPGELGRIARGLPPTGAAPHRAESGRGRGGRWSSDVG